MELQQLELNELYGRKAGQDDGLSLLEAEKRRQQEGEKRADIIFKRVLEKHHQQREKKTVSVPDTKDQFRPHEPKNPESESSADTRNTILLEGQAKQKFFRELGNAIVSGGEKAKEVGEKVVATGTSAIDWVAKSVNKVKSTVSSACSFAKVGASMGSSGLSILNPAASCAFWIVGKKISLFSWALSNLRVPGTEFLGNLFNQLKDCGTDIMKCIADKVLNGLLPRMTWESVRKLGRYLIRPAEGTKVFGLPELVTAGVLGDQLEGCSDVVKCIAGKVLNGDLLNEMEWPSVRQLGGYLIDPGLDRGLPQLANVGILGGELEGCTNMVECIAGKVLNDQLYKIKWPKVQQLGEYLTDPRAGKGLPQLANAGMLGGELEGCTNMVECIAGKVLNDQLYKIKWPKVQQLGEYLTDPRAGKGLPQLANAGMLGDELEGCTNMVECIAGKVLNDQLYKIKWPKVQQLGEYLTDPRAGKGLPQLANAGMLGDELEGCTNMVECIAGKVLNDQLYKIKWPKVQQLGEYLTDPRAGLPQLANAGMLGGELEGCTDMVKCLGGKIIDVVPPLSHLSRMGDIMADVLEGFTKVAATVAGQVLKGGSSLIQEAALSKFPPPGNPPVVHNSGSLVIKTHSQEHKPKFSALQTKVTDEGIDINVHREAGSYLSKLITQLLYCNGSIRRSFQTRVSLKFIDLHSASCCMFAAVCISHR